MLEDVENDIEALHIDSNILVMSKDDWQMTVITVFYLMHLHHTD